MAQTAINQEITARYAGRVSTKLPTRIVSLRLLAACEFGLLLLRNPADAVGSTRQIADSSAADADAIMTTANGISSAAAQVFDAADFNGAIGPSMIRPTRFITFTFNNHGDWDLTVLRLTGIDEAGAEVSEEIHIPNSGNVTRTSKRRYRKVVRIELPAQTGVNGTMAVGIAAGGAVGDYTADVDAICTASVLVSAAAAQTIGEAALDGVLAHQYTYPAKRVTVVFSNHGDWDATSMVIWGEDETGAPISDTIVIPNGGNGTVTSIRKYSKVTSFYVPVQTGAGGTGTIGYESDTLNEPMWGVLFEPDGVAVYDPSAEQAGTAVGYAANAMAGALIEGEIDMTSEVTTVEGAQVYVRMIAGGNEVRGQVRMDDDAGDCVPVAGMFFGESRAAGDVKVRVRPAA